MSLIDKISEISVNLSDRVEGQLNAVKQKVLKLPTFAGFLGDSDSSVAKPNSQRDQILNRVALNVAVTNVPGMPLDSASNVDDGNREFKTIGGVWGRDKQTSAVDFYRSAINPAKTELFDEEFYLPDSQKNPLAANGQYIHLNPKGSLDNSPEFKDKPRPENISDFDWRGFELVDAAQVPAQYLRGDGKISFENAGLAENQANALKRFVIDNNLVQTWDEGKFQEIFAAKAGTTIKLELTPAGQSNGKTVFSAAMNAESLKEFRAAVKEYRAAVEKDAASGVKGQQEATNMATDIPKVYVRAAIKTVQDAANTMLEVVDPSIQTDPHNLTRARIGDIMDSQLPPPRNGAREHALPRIDADPVTPDYNSDLFNRDILTGKVNKNGMTVGKVSETAVELSAPIVAGKVSASAISLQDLGLPKTTVVQIQAEKQAVTLLAQAGKSEPTITADLATVAKQNDGELIGLENRLKLEESLTRKIADRTLQNADKLVEKGFPRNQAIRRAMRTQIEGTNDTLRYTVSLSKENYTENVNQTLAALQKQGYKVEHTFDGWKLKGTPNDPGYRGLNVTLKSPNGQVFELQFHTPESFASKTAGHALYEEARSPLTSAERKEQIRQIQVKEAEKIPTPTNIEQLPSSGRMRKGVKTQ